VEFIKVKSGTVTIHFADNHHMVMDKGTLSDIRMRSRKTTVSDCSCFLRPGIDICVLSPPQRAADSTGSNVEPVSVLLNMNFSTCSLFFLRVLCPVSVSVLHRNFLIVTFVTEL
jgi:DNA repair and recombination RAD54-like protein